MKYVYSDQMFMYIHKEAQFRSNLRNSLIEIPYVNYIMDTELDIQVNNLISTPHMECADENQKYDLCSEKLTSARLKKEQCHLPFMKNAEVAELCKTRENMEESLKIFQSIHLDCPLPCSQVKINIGLNPVDWLYILMNPKFPVNTVIPGYYIKMPRMVVVSGMQKSYSNISFIAEFGGWVGLFLGVSILEAVELLFRKYMCSDINITISLLCIKIACTACLCFILFKCCEKIITGEKQLKVNIKNGLQNMSLSLCSMENVYKVPHLGASSTYLGHIPGFWSNATRLSNKVDNLMIELQNGDKVTIYNATQSEYSKYITNSIRTPKYGTFIESCHTLNLKNWNQIKTMEVKAKKVLFIYVHITGRVVYRNSGLILFEIN